MKTDLQIQTITSLEEIESLRREWVRLQGSCAESRPNADIDGYLANLEFRGEEDSPYIVAIRAKDELQTLFVGRQSSGKIRCTIGYRRVWEPKIKKIVFVYGGILGDPGEAEFDLFLQHLRTALGSSTADMVILNHLHAESSLYKYLQSKVKGLERGRPWLTNLHWDMEMPRNVDEFYRRLSRKHRKEIKRQMRLLSENLGGEWCVKTYEHESDVPRLCEDAGIVARKTYQFAMGISFVDNERHRKLLASRARLGWLKAHVLYCRDLPSAFYIGMQYGNTLHLNYTGYDPQWKRFSVGTILFVKMLEDLCNSNKVQRIDFGFGDADYKRSYCTCSWPEVTVYLFSRHLRPQIVNMVRGTCSGISSIGESGVKKLGYLAKIKTKWRRRIREKDKRAEARE